MPLVQIGVVAFTREQWPRREIGDPTSRWVNVGLVAVTFAFHALEAYVNFAR